MCVINPPTRTSIPSGSSESSRLLRNPWRESWAQQRQRMTPGREAEMAIIGEDILTFARRRKCRRRFPRRQSFDESRQPFHPERTPMGLVPMHAQGTERAGGGQGLERAPRQLCACAELIDAAERPLSPCAHDALGLRFGQPAHQAEAKPQCRAMLLVLERTMPGA